jgi:hypothetical protein
MVAASLTYLSLVSMAEPFTFILNAAMVDGSRAFREIGEVLNVCKLGVCENAGVLYQLCGLQNCCKTHCFWSVKGVCLGWAVKMGQVSVSVGEGAW